MATPASTETSQVWRQPELDGLELTRATYVTHAFGRHAHEAIAIGVIDEGVGEFQCGGATHRAPAGSVVLIAPGEVHTGCAGGATSLSYRMLYPPLSLLGRLTEAPVPGALPRFAERTAVDVALASRVRDVHRALQGPSAGLDEELDLLSLLEDVLVRYGSWRRAEAPSPRDARLTARLREYLHAHLERRVSLSELARLADRHPAHLVRLFSRVVGLPPHAYLKQIRIQRAKDLLRAGQKLSQVAASSGFADQSHLTRAFKQLVGTTPGRYQRDVLGSRTFKTA